MYKAPQKWGKRGKNIRGKFFKIFSKKGIKSVDNAKNI